LNVLLVYPHKKDIYHRIGFVLPPMGLAYVAAALRRAGHDVRILDFNVSAEKADFGKYDVVGISMDTHRFKSGLAVAKEAKAAGAVVMAGGAHVTFMDEEALKSGSVDYVVRGEGEQTAVDLLGALSGGDPAQVKGISFLRDGNLIRTPQRGFIEDLDGLLPARDLLKLHLYRSLEMGKRKITPVVTSRGCPYTCSFCASSEVSGKKWRPRSPEKVVDEVEAVVRDYGFNGIAFLDDNFSLSPQRVFAICEGILKRGLDIYWWCCSRADMLLRNEPMVKKMSEAGCKYVFVGFESGDQKTLDKYKKGTEGKAAKEVVELLRAYGISVHGSFIIGAVEETEEMVMNTIGYAKDINPQAVQFSLLTPYPGTRLYEEVKDRIATDDWDLYDCMHPVLKCEHLSRKDLARLLRKAYMSVYLSPKKLMAGLLSGLRGRGVRLGSIAKIIRGLG